MKCLAVTTVAGAIIALIVAAPVPASDDTGAFAHVRCVDNRGQDLLREGSRRSATFRRLLGEIEQSDVIVYVEMVAHIRMPVSAHLRMAGATPVVRYLRILMKAPMGEDNGIALLGHELQHATEVAQAAEVRDERTLEDLYRRIGSENDAGWDTRAARLVASIIRDELRQGDADER